MNNLIKITYDRDRPTVSGRELHEFLEVGTAYKDWFPRMSEYGFSEGIDFSAILSESTGGRPSTDHQLTIEMAKEIAMLQRTDKGKEARQYFINLEKAWNTPESVMARALKMANAKMDELTNMTLQLTAQVEELAPKGIFFDTVTGSKECVDIGTVAKVLHFSKGRNTLFKILRDSKILMHDNKPYQEYCDRGYFRVIESTYTKPNGDVCINFKTVVYQKGIQYIRQFLIKNGHMKETA